MHHLPLSLNNSIQQAHHKVQHTNNGNVGKWRLAIDSLAAVKPSGLTDNDGCLTLNVQGDTELITTALKQLLPWRKGPFQIADVYLDSEWRSDFKWHRIQPHLSDIKGKMVLDVGGGNGYFSYQLALQGAKTVLLAEPFLLFYYQFLAINSLIAPALPIVFYPDKIERLNADAVFERVFSMGVLYHQKSPIEHLLMLKNALVEGGELIIETLVVEGGLGHHLLPEGRYARMRNVWFIPSVLTLMSWLKRCGFKEITLADITITNTQEQRSSEWLGDNAQSLKDFLNPSNPDQTIEGYPAPKRATVIAKR